MTTLQRVRLLALVATSLAVVVVVGLAWVSITSPRAITKEDLEIVQVGATDEELTALLGEPTIMYPATKRTFLVKEWRGINYWVRASFWDDGTVATCATSCSPPESFLTRIMHLAD